MTLGQDKQDGGETGFYCVFRHSCCW